MPLPVHVLRASSLAVLIGLGACEPPTAPDDTAPVDLTFTDPAAGVTVTIPDGALPDGLSADDVVISTTEDRPENLHTSVTLGLSTLLVLEPAGTLLSAPMTVELSLKAPTARTTPIDAQVTDAITQADLVTLGTAPQLAMGMLYSTTALASGTALQNAVVSQASQNMLNHWTVMSTVQGLYALDSLGISVNGTSLPGARDGVPDLGLLEFVVVDDVVRVRFETSVFDTYALMYFAMDQDHNGIHDLLEGSDDLDGDGSWNFDDWDNDGDRVADDVEGGTDQDGDGLPAFNDTDSDGDATDDGVPSCEGATCACAWRIDGARVACSESGDASCFDQQTEAFLLLYEIVPGTCPTAGATATCTSSDDATVAYYDVSGGYTHADFCAVCSTDITPSDFCQD